MSKALNLELPDVLAEEIDRAAVRQEGSVNDIGLQVFDEWARLKRFPFIEFRRLGSERVAYLSRGPAVWQVVAVALGYDENIVRAAAHLNIKPEQVAIALGYYWAYTEEIDSILNESRQSFDRIKLILPTLQRLTFSIDEIASTSERTVPFYEPITLRLLLAEDISPIIAKKAYKIGGGQVRSVYEWLCGAMPGCSDRAFLLAAWGTSHTVVTYDHKSIPYHMQELAAEGRRIRRLVFLDSLTIPNRDEGIIARALRAYWQRFMTFTPSREDHLLFLELSLQD